MIHAAAPGATTTVSPRSGKISPSTTVTFEVRADAFWVSFQILGAVVPWLKLKIVQ
jgi:hypothetical protein